MANAINWLRPFSILLCFVAGRSVAAAEPPIEIGSRLQPFVDRELIDQMTGDVSLHLNKPTPGEVVLVTDQPWEGNTCAYYTIFQDSDRYRMYYRGSHFDEKTRKATHREVTCYAESRDGIHWTKPELNLFEFNGSKRNNIVWDGVGTHDFTPFKDTNPDCAPEARYKALCRESAGKKHGLYALQSSDGIHWKLMQSEPVITKGAFDSQNLAFWDSQVMRYREYHRSFRDGVRDIMTGTSHDFLHWTDPIFLKYPGAPKEHLYTNAIRPYPRAPQLLIGFPTRYLPQEGSRVEPIFMTSRDGVTFHRWSEAVIPETAPKDRSGNRSNYMTWGLVKLPGDDQHYTVYATEAYYTGPDTRVRRFTYRVDGFVSVHAATKGGELLTKPFRFSGRQLVINFATAHEGSLRIEIQDADGKPMNGFRFEDCPLLQGDAIEYAVSWQRGGELAGLADRPIRLRFQLKDVDLYTLQFRH